jgi:prepilin-type processing-associated H-X9-DG protein
MRKRWSGIGWAALVLIGCGGGASVNLTAPPLNPGGGGGNNSGGTAELYAESVKRLKRLNTGLLMYAGDSDDVLPLAPSWADALAPYVRNDLAFRSPALGGGPGVYGYAFNSEGAGKQLNRFSDPSTVVSFFDSTVITKNATAPVTTMPNPPRYGTKNTVAYLDGHVKDEISETDPPADLLQVSISRLKASNLAVIMYSQDNDDQLPLPNVWMDAVALYARSETNFRSPSVQLSNPQAYGYALNELVTGRSLVDFETPHQTVSAFDSTVLSRNATVPISTIPNPPRYGDANTIGYLDGHVKAAARP